MPSTLLISMLGLIKYHTLSSSKLKFPYSMHVPCPLSSTLQPDIIMVPESILVMVEGNRMVAGLCVVTPT